MSIVRRCPGGETDPVHSHNHCFPLDQIAQFGTTRHPITKSDAAIHALGLQRLPLSIVENLGVMMSGAVETCRSLLPDDRQQFTHLETKRQQVADEGLSGRFGFGKDPYLEIGSGQPDQLHLSLRCLYRLPESHQQQVGIFSLARK